MVEKQHQINELYRLLSVTIIIFAALTSFITFLYNKNRVTEIGKYDIMMYFLLIFVILIGIYLLFVISVLMFEYYIFTIDKPKKQQVWLLSHLRKHAYEGFTNTIWTAFLSFLLIFLGVVLIISPIIGISVFALWLCGIILGNKIGKELLSIFKKRRISSFQKIIFSTIITLLILLSFGTIWNYIILFSSGFDITSDKPYYTQNDDIHIQIYPKGIIKPSIRNITYASVALNYTANPIFKQSPVYVVIPHEILRTEPWNSILVINYQYRTGYFLDIFPSITNRKEFVPVYR